jgi:hypothetical protein
LSYGRAGRLQSGPKRARLRPQCGSDGEGIDTGLVPPFGFVAAAVDLAMVNPAERHRKLVAHPAPERRILGKPEVVRVSRLAATDQTWLAANEFHMSFVAQPARRALLSIAAGFERGG